MARPLARTLRVAVALATAPWAAAASASAPPPAASEEAIRALLLRYETAIEEQDIEMFRTVKPNLSRDEQERLERSFRSIQSHAVEITVVSIEVEANRGRVVIRRRDTLNAGTASEVVSAFPQTLALESGEGGWRIESIGR